MYLSSCKFSGEPKFPAKRQRAEHRSLFLLLHISAEGPLRISIARRFSPEWVHTETLRLSTTSSSDARQAFPLQNLVPGTFHPQLLDEMSVLKNGSFWRQALVSRPDRVFELVFLTAKGRPEGFSKKHSRCGYHFSYYGNMRQD